MSNNADPRRHSDQEAVLEPIPLKHTIIATCECTAALIVFIIVVVISSAITGFRFPPWIEIVGLFLAVNIVAWRHGRRIGALLNNDDLLWLAACCTVAFILVDICLPRLLQWTGVAARKPDEGIAIVAVELVLCALEVAAMVFITVPVGQKIYGRARVA